MLSALMWSLFANSAERSTIRSSTCARSRQKLSSASMASPIVGTVAIRDRMSKKVGARLQHLFSPINLVGRSSCLGVVMAGERIRVKSASVKSLAVPRYVMMAFLSSSSLRRTAARNLVSGA